MNVSKSRVAWVDIRKLTSSSSSGTVYVAVEVVNEPYEPVKVPEVQAPTGKTVVRVSVSG